jgi:hypothetical protein
MKNPDEKQTVGSASALRDSLNLFPKETAKNRLSYRGNWRSREEEEEEEDAVVEDLATSIVVEHLVDKR